MSAHNNQAKEHFMANEDDFNAIWDLLEAISVDDVGRLNVPATVLAQEAEDLSHRAADDEEKLVAAGLPKGTIASYLSQR